MEGTSLVLLSKERNNKNAVIRRTILSIRERRARQIALPPLRSIDIEWGSATSCTTDGSWSQSGNVTQHLTNDLVTSCGAALVLTDGEMFTGAVRITGEPSLHHHAFTVESIALATAIISRPDLPVYSDCKGAIGFIERCSHGRYRSNDLSWLTEPLRDRGHHLSWIPSHPEKTTPLHQFTMSHRANIRGRPPSRRRDNCLLCVHWPGGLLDPAPIRRGCPGMSLAGPPLPTSLPGQATYSPPE